jgi:tRNA1(Val) A37 N6-methylase TrmN6
MVNANAKVADITTLLDGRVKIMQPQEGLRAGLDAVMLAASVPARAGEHVLDVGCGTGAAGLCVMARARGVTLSGLDIQPDLIEFACASAELNGWAAVTHFYVGDVRDKTQLPSDTYDHALCNPPYMQEGAWYESPNPVRQKQMGNTSGDAKLCDWIDCLQRVVKPHGSVSLVHRADHMDRLIQALGTRFGGLEIWPLYPRVGVAASRVIIRALKNRKSPLTLHAGLVLHEANGDFSVAADNVLRRGQGF